MRAAHLTFSSSASILATASLIVLGSVAACSSGHDIAPTGDYESPSASGGRRATGGEAQGGAGGEAPEGSGGKMGFGGAVTGPDPEPDSPPLCPPDAEWGTPVSVAGVSTPGGVERLLALTPDELTLMFDRDGAVLLAERANANEDFAVSLSQPVPAGYDVDLGVAISSDGLLLILTQDGKSGFAEFTRTSRSVAFELTPNEVPYEVINSLSMMAGVDLSHPVLAADSSELWWVEGRSETSVWMAAFEGETISRGAQVGCNSLGCTLMLDGYGGAKNLLTGLSEDLRTVFTVDDLSGQQGRNRAGTRLDSGFFEEFDLSPRLDVRPNKDCTKLYSSSAGDILFETR